MGRPEALRRFAIGRNVAREIVSGALRGAIRRNSKARISRNMA